MKSLFIIFTIVAAAFLFGASLAQDAEKDRLAAYDAGRYVGQIIAIREARKHCAGVWL